MKYKESEVINIFDKNGKTLEQIIEEILYEMVKEQFNIEL